MNKFRAVPPFIANCGSWKTTGIASGSGSSLLSVVFTLSLTLTHVGMVRCPGENHAALAGSPHLRGDGPVKRHRVLFGFDERPQPIVLGRLPSPAGRDLGKPPQTVPGGLRLSLGSAAEQWAESWL